MRIYSRHLLIAVAKAILVGCAIGLVCTSIPFLVRAQEIMANDGQNGIQFARLLGRLHGVWLPCFSVPALLVWTEWVRDGRAQAIKTEGLNWLRVAAPAGVLALVLFSGSFAAMTRFMPEPRPLGRSEMLDGHLTITLHHDGEARVWRVGDQSSPWHIDFESRPLAKDSTTSATEQRSGLVWQATISSALVLLSSLVAGMSIAAGIGARLARISAFVPLLAWLAHLSLRAIFSVVYRRPPEFLIDLVLALAATFFAALATLMVTRTLMSLGSAAA